jgi:hypothetical protein
LVVEWPVSQNFTQLPNRWMKSQHHVLPQDLPCQLSLGLLSSRTDRKSMKLKAEI